ncbi:alpha/beta hydrolase [Streptomyces sp. CA-278952]|uniref:alpha/beta fold hydrolase n=1 Tax=Streptomyces sp. CA-278952 TaxID=2980556 RepID=UPI00236871D8|nr:alpha/beta hydrolase [Streptomyces sp. CA-278952]WDG30716.1 alpha/beta hydrolase [Streptomyces sp. CA-278952]
MTSVYRSEQARAEVRRWCVHRIDGSGLADARSEVVTSAGVTGVVTAGPEPRDGEPSVVLLPGTNMNAALCLPVAEAIARERRVVVLDLPGQPGLSADRRPRAKRSSWYGKWLAEALARVAPGPVVVMGHSLGGAVALACDAPQIVGRVLLSSAGLVRLRVPAPLLAATVPWLLRPTVARSTALVRCMAAPGQGRGQGQGQVADGLGEWMDLVGRCCRTSLAPPPLPSGLLELRRSVPTLVATGEFDPFLPPCHLGPAVRRRLGAEFRVIEGAGHLLLDESPEAVLVAVREICAAVATGS